MGLGSRKNDQPSRVVVAVAVCPSMFDYQKIKQSFPVKVYDVKPFKIRSFGVSEGGKETLLF